MVEEEQEVEERREVEDEREAVVENDEREVVGEDKEDEEVEAWLKPSHDPPVCRYKKNLKALYVVHPTNFIRIVWNIFKPLLR